MADIQFLFKDSFGFFPYIPNQGTVPTGPTSNYPLSFPLQQVMNYYWAVREWTMDIDMAFSGPTPDLGGGPGTQSGTITGSVVWQQTSSYTVTDPTRYPDAMGWTVQNNKWPLQTIVSSWDVTWLGSGDGHAFDNMGNPVHVLYDINGTFSGPPSNSPWILYFMSSNPPFGVGPDKSYMNGTDHYPLLFLEFDGIGIITPSNPSGYASLVTSISHQSMSNEFNYPTDFEQGALSQHICDMSDICDPFLSPTGTWTLYPSKTIFDF